MVVGVNASASEESKKISAELLRTGNLDVQANTIKHSQDIAGYMMEETRISASRLATAATDKGIIEATRLANAAKDEAIAKARSAATSFATAEKDVAEDDASCKRVCLATAAKDEVIVKLRNKVTRLATSAKGEAIAIAIIALPTTQNTLSDAIVTMTTSLRQMM